MTTPSTVRSRKRVRSSGSSTRRTKRRLFARDNVPSLRFSNRVGGSVVVAKGNQPIPTKATVVMKYADITATGTPLFFAYEYRLNSTFDIDGTGGGHQPYGRDTYAALYSRYRVLAASWVVTFSNPIDTALAFSQNINWAVVPIAGTVTLSNVNAAMELPRAQFAATTRNGDPQIVMGRVKMNELAGVGIGQYRGDDDYDALAGANPSKVLALNVVCQSATGAAIVIQGTFSICISQTVEWFEPIQQVQS